MWWGTSQRERARQRSKHDRRIVSAADRETETQTEFDGETDIAREIGRHSEREHRSQTTFTTRKRGKPTEKDREIEMESGR